MKYLLIVALAFGTATISFGQQTRSADIASAGTPAKKVSMRSSVLYLLSQDDKTTEISKEEFKKIKKKDIEYTKVLKDPALLSMYGDKAKSGVVLVQMKQSADEKKKKGRQNSSRKTKQNPNQGNDAAALSTNKDRK
ncbi:MAG TPA: hypothetical protein VFD46_11665 [Chryseolinea sp.]|nr:hypothetical protein [Chryseolinea sp.]